MAVLPLVDDLKNDLKFLQGRPTQILGDFCKLAWSFIFKGSNVKMYQTASQKLQVEIKQIQSVVESLADFFIEAAKNEMDEEGFKETFTDLGFSENLGIIIYSEYMSQKDILIMSLPRAGVHHPQFKNLEWRFETQVSSKAVKKQMLPRVVMRFDLEKGTEVERICLQSSIPNVIHMSHIMSQALQDSRTQHSKRIQRAVINNLISNERRPLSDSAHLGVSYHAPENNIPSCRLLGCFIK